MEVEIYLNKSVDENAGNYFDKAKKAKAKLEGAHKALTESKKKLAQLELEKDKFEVEEEKKQKKLARKKEWYEKFHWFISSEGYLCIGGKDATSNDIIIKKHLDKEDLVFHTEMPGSPFFIIKDGQNAGEATKQEAAQATAAYSRAWRNGLGTAEVYSIGPDQVKKEMGLPKGTFMIYGKREYYQPRLELAIGLVGEEIIGGPVNAVKEKTDNFVTIIAGPGKKSEIAKKILKKFGARDLDDISKFTPSGGASFKK
ncbi:MAG: NFACT family protein [archaeon]|nr:DUF814 domain-containing protein [Nanoarchaeota archaeon]